MAVVIRLQGLRITAGSEDIRKFFTGLKIPDGGVHIIGGEREEAFIIFASDEDARRAMTRSGGLIENSPVTLLLSSKAEMQSLLERSTKTVEQNQERQLDDTKRHPQRFADPEMGRGPGGKMGLNFPPHPQIPPHDDDGSCLFVKGLPFSVTEKEVAEFFHGLFVDDIYLMKKPNGSNNGKGFVKFATREDAVEGLKRDKEYIGTRYIEISQSAVKDFCRAAGKMPFMRGMRDGFERGRSPVFTPRNPPERVRSRSPVAQRHIAPSDDYCVRLENLSFAAEKANIRQLFPKIRLDDDQIIHLFDGEGKRTRSAFVMFNNPRDYCNALSLEKVQSLNRLVKIRPVSKENMIAHLESQSKAGQPPGNVGRPQERGPNSNDAFGSENICVFVRNLPFDVRKVEIMDFFYEFNISEDKVCVLHDHKGAGVGKALVLFGSEAEAMMALSLNGRRFLGSEVILRSISRSQMQELIADPPEMQELQPPEDQFSGGNMEPFFRPGDSRHPNPRMSRDEGMSVSNIHGQSYGGGFDFQPRAVRSRSPNDGGNGVRHGFDSSGDQFDGPTSVQLVNLPFQIKTHEIYDFCYGFRVVPGSVSLQYEPSGKSKGCATLLFESRQEALMAVGELNGRPIGSRKIQLLLV